MLARWFFVPLALALIAGPANATFIPRNIGTVSSVAPSCGGWNVAGYADGCSGAPPSGPYTVQYPNFLTATSTLDNGVARQSGQPTYGNVGTNTGCVNPNCHPPWAIAGVDYPVGPSCGSTCGFASPGSATDPTNASSPNWGAGNPGNCVNTSGVGNPPIINCKGTMTTGTLDIGPFDFSYQGNSTGVAPAFIIGSGIQVPCIIHDVNFAFDMQTTPTPVATIAYNFIGGCTSLTFLNDKFSVLDSTTHQPTAWNWRQSGTASGVTISGTAFTATSATTTLAAGQTITGPGIASGTQLISGSGLSWTVSVSQTVSSPVTANVWGAFGVSYYVSAGASVLTVNKPTTVKYSAFLNCPTRCISFGGDMDFEFNYWSGLNTFDSNVTNPAHGDGWFVAFNNQSLGGSGLNYQKAFNNTWVLLPNMNTGLGAVNGVNGGTCLICTNIIVQTGFPVVNVQNGSSSMVVDSNGAGGITEGGGIMHPQIGNASYNYGGFPPAYPGPGWPASFLTCPATGCGTTAQVTFSGSVSGTALTTDASTTLQTNEFVATTGVLFTGATLTGTSLTATGSGAATPMVGDQITGTNVPAGTWLVSGSGLSWTLNQSVTGTVGPETITSSGPSPASPLIVAGGTGTSFTLSTSVGTIPDQSWLGQTGLGTWTMDKPWVSTLSGPIGSGAYLNATVGTLDFERNMIIGNFTNSNSPSWLGTPQVEVASPIDVTLWSTNETIANNYFDVCGFLQTTTSACTSPTSTAAQRSYFPGPVSTTYADGSNIEMNNGACLFVQGTQPATCAPIPP